MSFKIFVDEIFPKIGVEANFLRHANLNFRGYTCTITKTKIYRKSTWFLGYWIFSNLWSIYSLFEINLAYYLDNVSNSCNRIEIKLFSIRKDYTLEFAYLGFSWIIIQIIYLYHKALIRSYIFMLKKHLLSLQIFSLPSSPYSHNFQHINCLNGVYIHTRCFHQTYN